MTRRTVTNVLLGGLLAFGLLAVTSSGASAQTPPSGTAAVAASPTSMTAPGTFQVSGTFTYDPGVLDPSIPVPSSVAVQLQLIGTDGLVTLGAVTPGPGLLPCVQTLPSQVACDITNIAVAGSFTLSATATVTAVPPGGLVFLEGYLIARYASAPGGSPINENLAIADPDVRIDIASSPPPSTTLPPPTTAPPTTATIPTPTTTAPAAGAPTTPSTTSAPIGLPATGSREDRAALLAGLLVLAGVVALAASRARRSAA